jgi:hypothetical protein
MDIRLSHARGILDDIMASFQRVAFRCRWCDRRFYRHVPVTEEGENPATAEGSDAFVWNSTVVGGASPGATGTPLVSFPLRFEPPLTGASPCSQSYPL